MKKFYMKPTMKMVEMSNDAELLAGSGDPTRNVPWWDGEGDSRSGGDDDRFWNDDWDEEE